jgi:DNA-directed RNA polymerase subunit alpha
MGWECYCSGVLTDEPSSGGITPKIIMVPDGILDWSVEELNFCIRTSTGLEELNVKTVGDLLQKSERELLAHRRIGKKSISEITEILGEYGLSLKKDPPRKANDHLSGINDHE